MLFGSDWLDKTAEQKCFAVLHARTWRIAHRGMLMHAPENTLASIRLAVEERADWVEIDVQECRVASGGEAFVDLPVADCLEQPVVIVGERLDVRGAADRSRIACRRIMLRSLTTGAALATPLWNLDHEQLLLSLEAIATNREVVGASIKGEDGEVMMAVGESGAAGNRVLLERSISFDPGTGDKVIGSCREILRDPTGSPVDR